VTTEHEAAPGAEHAAPPPAADGPAVGQPVAPAARKRSGRKRIRPTRRGLVTAGVTLGLIVLAGVLWVAVRGVAARGALQRARAAVLEAESDYRAGRIVPGRLATDVATEQAARAKGLTNDPVWHLVGHLPLVGSTLQVSAGLSAAADELARVALPAAGRAAEEVTGRNLRTPDGGVDLVHLRTAGADIGQAAQVLARVRADVAALPAHPLLGSVGSARTELLGEMDRIGASIATVDTGARLAVPMLGGNGVRRYFLAFQNGAELRGTGGIVGAYAVVEADAGRLRLLDVGSNLDLVNAGDKPATFSLGPDYDARWGAFQPTTIWQQSNVAPEFPDAASIWLSLWEKQTGQRLDGALALDPTVAGYLLSATGATITLPDGTALTGNRVVAYTESRLYVRYATDNAGRKAALVGLTRQVFDQLRGGADAKKVLDALARGAREGRVLVSSTRPDEQRLLLGTDVSGLMPTGAGPFAHLVLDNAGANKVDYYLDRSTSYDVGACAGGRRQSTYTVDLRNGAPAGGLPDYVLGHLSGPPGTNRVYASLYVGLGARVVDATVNGQRAILVPGTERGRPVFSTYLLMPPGQSARLVVRLDEPAGGTVQSFRQQPLVRTGSSRVNVAPCA